MVPTLIPDPVDREALARTVRQVRRSAAESSALRKQARERREALKVACDTYRYGLGPGLDIRGVRQRLTGWSDHPVLVSDASEGFCCAVWDFTPPGGNAPKLRLTFFNGRLVVWGRPCSTR